MQPFIPKHFPGVFILHTYTGVIPSFLVRNNIQPYTYAAVCLTHTVYKADWLVGALRLPRNPLKDDGPPLLQPQACYCSPGDCTPHSRSLQPAKVLQGIEGKQ